MNCLCVEYIVQLTNNNKFVALLFLSPEESEKFSSSYEEDRRSVFRRLQVALKQDDGSVQQHNAVVASLTPLNNKFYTVLSALNDKAIIGLTNVYHSVCQEIVKMSSFSFGFMGSAMNVVLDREPDDTDDEDEEHDMDDGDEEEECEEADEEESFKKDLTIHELVYASNVNELYDMLSTCQFSAVEEDDQGVMPLFMVDCNPEQADKAVIIVDLLLQYGASFEKGGKGYNEDMETKDMWLLPEAIRMENWKLASHLVERGHPTYNFDERLGPCFNVSDFFNTVGY